MLFGAACNRTADNDLVVLKGRVGVKYLKRIMINNPTLTTTPNSDYWRDGYLKSLIILYYNSSTFQKKTENEQKKQVQMLNRFADFMGDNPINTRNLYIYNEYLRGRLKLADNTAGRHFTALKAVIKHAINMGIMQANPLDKLELGNTKSKYIVAFLTKSKRKQLLNYLLNHKHGMAYAVEFSIETGLRKGELLKLKWDNIDIGNKEMLIKETKNGCDRTVPLSPNAITILELKSELFTKSDVDFYQFKKAVHNIGIPNFRWHDLRHTFGTWCVKGWHSWLNNPLNLYQTALFMGHKDVSQTKKYAHLQVGDLKNLINY